MSSIPMPFFATRGAVLYTERIRSEKEPCKKDFDTELNSGKDGKHFQFD